MRCRGWLGVLLLAAWPQVAQAQTAADDSLDETQKLGRRLFGNHCVVCHEAYNTVPRSLGNRSVVSKASSKT